MRLEARVRARDVAWGLFSLVAAAVIIRLLFVGVVVFASEPSLGQLLALVIATPVIVGVGRWFVWGAWRRTVWGAPDGGVREHQERRLRERASRS